MRSSNQSIRPSGVRFGSDSGLSGVFRNRGVERLGCGGMHPTEPPIDTATPRQRRAKVLNWREAVPVPRLFQCGKNVSSDRLSLSRQMAALIAQFRVGRPIRRDRKRPLREGRAIRVPVPEIVFPLARDVTTKLTHANGLTQQRAWSIARQAIRSPHFAMDARSSGFA